MARNNNLVLLGYEDELVTDKNKSQIDFAVNKIGGVPHFPTTHNTQQQTVLCDLCKWPSRLVVQIYAPLENLQYHRTLYLFACINPSCWNKNESWTCLRVQCPKMESMHNTVATPKSNSTDWCSEADDWGDDNNINLDEENCNVISNNKLSDDEESSSFEDSVRSGFRNLSIDEKNANNCAQVGAAAHLHPAMATAEIEGDADGEVVTIETPTTPQINLRALLHGASSDMDNIPLHASFISYFMSVYPEEEDASLTPMMDSHIKELLSDYQRQDADFSLCPSEEKRKGGSDGDVEMAAEDYEKSRPLHGDKMFHDFVTKIKSNPEQILRYHREGPPLLIHPLQEPIKTCKYCQAEQVFEFQLIPTIISKLRLECDPMHSSHIDFGTVLIYTCKDSCSASVDEIKLETVICQKEIS